MNIPLYQVDTFTSVVFKGNPAAVCVLDKWLSEGLMQEIAAENNLSETAFVVKKDNLYELKWFTPLSEVDLCGHATLAAAFILFRFYDTEASRIEFETKSGAIFVEKSGPLLSLFFPERRGEAAFTVEGLPRALGNAEPEKILLARDYLVIYSDEAIVRSLTPQMDLLKKVPVM
ncbi:MAG: PhzF family phenazine biosynthesis protein, partial [Nitrospinota bacterium]